MNNKIACFRKLFIEFILFFKRMEVLIGVFTSTAFFMYIKQKTQ